MMAPKLPAVLQQPNGNSISMERALKQIKELLESVTSPVLNDKVDASLDDVETMLNAIDRG